MSVEMPAPDSTAMRVALWRALHTQIDARPHIFDDDVGLRLVAPEESWRLRPDMDPAFTRPFRASIVARARFIEDLVLEEVARGVGQYVMLGAGLDTFAYCLPRHPGSSRGYRGETSRDGAGAHQGALQQSLVLSSIYDDHLFELDTEDLDESLAAT